jgi:hypothetical protein
MMVYFGPVEYTMLAVFSRRSCTGGVREETRKGRKRKKRKRKRKMKRKRKTEGILEALRTDASYLVGQGGRQKGPDQSIQFFLDSRPIFLRQLVLVLLGDEFGINIL